MQSFVFSGCDVYDENRDRQYWSRDISHFFCACLFLFVSSYTEQRSMSIDDQWATHFYI